MLKLGKTIQIGNRDSKTSFDPDIEVDHKWVIHFIRFILLHLDGGDTSDESENKVVKHNMLRE